MNTSKTPEVDETRTQKPAPSPTNGKRGQPASDTTLTSSADGSLDLRHLLRALTAARDGDFSVRLPSDLAGVEGKIADVFNDIMLSNQRMADELERMSRVVGKEGKIQQTRQFRLARRRVERNGGLSQHIWFPTWPGRWRKSPAPSTPWPKAI